MSSCRFRRLEVAALCLALHVFYGAEVALGYDYGYLAYAVAGQSSAQGVVLATTSDSSQTRDQGYKKGKYRLDVENLTEILNIDPETSLATVQTKCTFSELVQATLPYGLIPRVVPEFTSITVGGAMVGGGLESTSHRYGQVSDVVRRATVLLGNGTIVDATVTSHSDLFHALPGSYGSLGVVLELDIDLMEATQHVELTVSVYDDVDGGIKELIAIAEGRKTSPVFLEALHLPDKRFVVVAGDWKETLEKSETLVRPTTGRGLWFYEHIEDAVKARNRGTHEGQECAIGLSSRLVLPIYDYLFRYERGAFWMARPMEFDWSYCTKNVVTCGLFFVSWRGVRWFFSDMFSATRLYRMLHLADEVVVARRMIIMDADVPAINASSLVKLVRDDIPITTPIWLLPVRAPDSQQPASNTGHARPGELLINIGIYGRVPDDEGIAYSRTLAKAVMGLGGRNMLYSQQDMSKEEFYKHQVDEAAFRMVREAYAADGVFPPLHEKVLRTRRSKEASGRWRYHLSSLML